MSKLRFVHAADLHLDSPFQGIRSGAPEHVAQTLHNSTFSAFKNIIDLCLSENVDALLIAGDIYDSADRSLRAQLRFVDGLRQLDEAGIRSFVCHGNHDPLDGWEARLPLPNGCVRFSSDVTAEPIFPDDPERATVHGISYPHRDVRQNLSSLFDQAPLGCGVNIGLLHANVGGNPNHDPYSPCSVADLTRIGLDYWALGHVHTHQVLRESNPTIVYPGNPQGRQPNESSVHGVYLVEMDDSGRSQLDFRPMNTVRWETVERGIAGIESENHLLEIIDQVACSTLESSDGVPIVLRITLTGRGHMHRFLRRPEASEELLEWLNEKYSISTPWLWCERIRIATSASIDRSQLALREDFTGDLVRLADKIRNSPPALIDFQKSLSELYLNSNASFYLRRALPSENEIRDLLTAAEEECVETLVHDEEDA